MKSENLSELTKGGISVTRLSEYMVSFFTQIIEFCINELSARLDTEKKQQTAQNSPKIEDNFLESSYESLTQDIPKKQEGYKKKRKRNMQQKPQFLLNKPKAPTSSYLIYLHSAKSDIAAKYNINNVAQLTKLVSLQWRKLSEQEKEEYNTKSEIQKQRYKQQMQIYKKRYANQIKAYKKQKQVKYKNNWIENKKKKIEGGLNRESITNINQIKKKLKSNEVNFEENEFDSCEENQQDQKLISFQVNKK